MKGIAVDPWSALLSGTGLSGAADEQDRCGRFIFKNGKRRARLVV